MKSIYRSILKFMMPGAIFFWACSTTELLDADQGGVSGSQTQVGTTIQNMSTCTMVGTSSGISVICDGAIVGTLANGQDGADGKDGVGCYMTALEEYAGYYVTCGDQVGVIINGKDGIDGKDGVDGVDGIDGASGKDGLDGQDGASCRAIVGTVGYDLYCGDTFVGTLKHGANGIDGINGVNGAPGQDGTDGAGCYAAAFDAGDTSGYSLYCGDSLVGYIYNGSSSIDTLVIRDSLVIKDTLVVKDTLVQLDSMMVIVYDTIVVSKKDTVVVSGRDTVVVKDTVVVNEAVGCSIVSATESTIKIACGRDTSEVQANVTVNNTYNNGKLESTTFDPIIVYASSSSVSSSSSRAEVVVNSSSSLNYNVDLKVSALYVWATKDRNATSSSYLSIYRGDSTLWKMNMSSTSSVADILASTYEWKFPGAKNIESYTAVGNDGLTTPYVVYDSIGTFRASYSINGSAYKTSNYYVTVKASLIKSCSCREDTTYNHSDTTKWVLSGCSSYAPITKYTWDGAAYANETEAYTPKSYSGQTTVTVTNSDNTVKEVACGYVLDDGVGYTFGPGTYYLSYACNEVNIGYAYFVRTSSTGSATWITNRNSVNFEYSSNPTYGTLFGTSSNEAAAGSSIALIVNSGTYRAYCW